MIGEQLRVMILRAITNRIRSWINLSSRLTADKKKYYCNLGQISEAMYK